MRVENQELQETEAGVSPPHRGTKSVRPKHARHSRLWILVLAILSAALLIVFGILPRIQARTELRKETADMAIPTVAVVKPKHSAPTQEIILPANVQAYADAPIYARTNGYLKRWYVDIGAHVKAGQLLAEIDTPEVNQQLRQAHADLATAEANLNLSKITAERYTGLLLTDSVSKQEADNAEGDYKAKLATAQAAQANVKRLEEVQSFQKIYAPFDGIITARNTDIGALIDSGSSGGVRNELFHIAQPDRLRVYANVPESYSQATKPGMAAELTLSEFPGRRFEGKLVRTANAIDPTSRTLLVEVSVNNPTGQLFTGAYSEVHFKLPTSVSSLLLPVDTLLFRSEGLRVATVGEGQRVDLKPIIIGHDFGNQVEILSGLTGDDTVIVNPPDSVVAGQVVRIAQSGGNQGAQ